MHLFIMYLWERPRFFVMWVFVVIFSICCHEFAHAWTAVHEGDPTPENLGHLSMNPMRQMGPISLIMLLVIGIAWGAVPVIPRNFRSKYSELYVSGAGPLMNLILVVVFTMVYAVISHAGDGLGDKVQFAFLQMLFIGIFVNIMLFLLNMLPVPPLDGWKVWSYVVPAMNRIEAGTARMLQSLVFIIIFLGAGVLWGISYKAGAILVGLTRSPVVNIYEQGPK